MSVFIVSRKRLFGELLASFCKSVGFQILGVVQSLSEVVRPSESSLVILHVDSSMSDFDEIGVQEFNEEHPHARIFAIVSQEQGSETVEKLSPHVDAILPNDTSTKSLAGFLTVVQEGFKITGTGRRRSHGPGQNRGAHALRSRPQNGSVPHSASGLALVETGTLPRGATTNGSEALRKLSLRETEVITLLMKGASNKEIATKLNIVENTVKVHLRSCYGKIGVKNRTQAALWAAGNLDI